MAGTRRLKRGIYLLPTVFTVGNLFCGYWSIVQAFRGAIEQAAILIVIAAILDGIDGRIARLTRTTSPFGVEFDSLADMVSFGVAPALLAYQWALSPLGRTGWLIPFIFVVCTAMRLARFNIQAAMGDKRFFAGLPCPAAGGTLACVAFFSPEPVRAGWLAILMAAMVCSLGLLMVSRLRYYSFKDFDLRSRRSYLYVLPLAAVLLAIIMYPQEALLLFSSAYVISAPAYYLWGLLSRKRSHSRVRGEEVAAETEVADEPALQ
jgi:CDP-diacylglycerol--serine O-phosphatidyltransferase